MELTSEASTFYRQLAGIKKQFECTQDGQTINALEKSVKYGIIYKQWPGKSIEYYMYIIYRMCIGQTTYTRGICMISHLHLTGLLLGQVYYREETVYYMEEKLCQRFNFRHCTSF